MGRDIEESWGRRSHRDLPDGAAGQWCVISATIAGAGPWWAKLELTDEARGQVVREVFLGPRRRAGSGLLRRETLVHVPGEARALTLLIFGEAEGGAGALSVRVTPLARPRAAASLLWRGRHSLAGSLLGSPLGLLGRLRAVLGRAPAVSGEAPPYQSWLRWFAEPALAGEAAWDVQVAVIGADPAAAARSLPGTAAQRGCAAPPEAVLIRTPEDWTRITAPWVILLAAGDVLAPWAVRRFADAAAAAPWARFLTADCDRIGAESRCDPLFKPGPDPWLLPSGLPVQGACAVRWSDPPPALPAEARSACLTLAQARTEATAHVPHLLSSVAGQYGIAPVPPHAASARRARFRGVLTVPDGSAARRPTPDAPSVSIVVPSALRRAHAAACLERVMRGTDYPGLAATVVVSSPENADNGVHARVRSLHAVRITPGPGGPFNFPAAINAGAAAAQGEFILLLNDDVAPACSGWLRAMVALMRDARVGIVGARLFYGNGTVQHEGVVMGLANLCEHAGRLNDGAPRGMGALTRQVSAVTAACMLVRRTAFESLGGLNPAYAIALNDVDFCLRARRAGWRVVYCAQATLFHYESLSLGRHYAGARAGLEALEVRRLRQTWPDAIAHDPFYNRQAALQPGREWQPAFPPRCPEAVVCPANTLARN